MVTGSHNTPVSTMLVDESFANQDDQFIEQLRTVSNSKYLAGLADRWKKDPRPWAQDQIFQYLTMPLDRPGHHPLVKRLFKHAEENRNHELVGAFLVSFDRLIRRQRRTRYHYDWQTRQSWQEEELFSPRDQILPAKGKAVPQFRREGQLFSYRTRGYLRRRAARYFRRMGFLQPADYVSTVAAALSRYQDQDVARGENILDNWSLMHIAFRYSPALEFTRTRVKLADGRSLGELVAAPQFEELWKQPESAAVLLRLVVQAQSRLVRVWAMQLLKRDHAHTLHSITAAQLLELLDHADEEVQQFGAGLLEMLAGVDSWTIATWLKLLETRSMTALATICQTMSQRVNPQRLSLEQCIGLACARATPVARLGLSWLTERSIKTIEDQRLLGRLATAQCDAVGADVSRYALAFLGSPEDYRADSVSPFFDSLNAQVRRGAWGWLTPQSAGYDDPELWSRLLETPYDDIRIRLVENLTLRANQAAPRALQRQDLSTVWTTVLLGVHRGGRAKLSALRQISQAISERPERAELLIPVLAVAIRSVRPPEARAGLSAILSAVAARPELEELLGRAIPELRLMPAGGTR
ncbi:MAG: hypothetical protein JWP89_4669 [Schlesneria sp.]|nr:hypothetical protein [Schlesneria sp.]